MTAQHLTRKTTQPSPTQGDRAVRGANAFDNCGDYVFGNVSYPLQAVARPQKSSQSYNSTKRYALAERLDVSRVSTSAYPGNTN